jgi:hypothetical protein
MFARLVFLAVVSSAVLADKPDNLIRNPDFEEAIQNEWMINSGYIERVGEPFEGSHSAKVHSR